LNPQTKEIKGFWLFVSSFLISFGATTILMLWIPTPSYNFLNYTSLLLFSWGAVKLTRNLSDTIPINSKISAFKPYFGWLLIAIAGYLSFAARPFTAVILIILIFIWAIFKKPFPYKGILFAALLSLAGLFVTAILVDGSFSAFIARYLTAKEELEILGSHQATALFSIVLSYVLLFINFKFVLVFFLFFLAGVAINYTEKYEKTLSNLSVPLVALTLFIIYLSVYPYLLWHNAFAGYYLWAPLAGIAVYGAWKDKFPLLNKNDLYRPLFALLLLLPLAYGVGSNNSVLLSLSTACFFTFLSLLIIVRSVTSPEAWPFRLSVIAVLCFIVSCLLVVNSTGNPYRQPHSLWTFNTKAYVQEGSSELSFTPFIAEYLNTLHLLSKDVGFKKETPIFDLSGRAPGVVYALSAYTPKAYWLNSLPSGANAFALRFLSKMTCQEISSAWLLWENNPRGRTLSFEILTPFGIEPNDYEIAFVLNYPTDFGINSFASRAQILFKPVRDLDSAIQSCEAARKQSGF
jgi:hypothetical protein